MHRYDVAILRGAAVPTAVAALLLVLAGALLAGAEGALGAGLGAVVVGAFFTVGVVAIAWASRISPFVMMQVAILTYLVKIALLGVLVVTLADTEAFNTRAFAAAVLVSTLVWVLAEVRAFSRLKMPYVEPGSGPPGGPAPTAPGSVPGDRP
jgi:ATP synthase protein I